MSTPQATYHDAELILKLYELRREAVMREARTYVFSAQINSVDDMLKVANAFGTKENAYFRQVAGYWDMVAAFVLHGALNPLLVFDTCNEMYFTYAIVRPYLKEFREKNNTPDFLANVEKVAEGSAEGRERLARLEKRLAARKAMQAKA